MHLYLDDTTRVETDAIVSAAGTDLRCCPGICDAISAAADMEKLERAYRKLGYCRTGRAIATPGCELPCRYIIHVVGPGWYGGEPQERFLLARYHQSTPHKAYLCNYRRVVVSLIFSGDYHMPRAASLQVAGAAVADFCQRHPSMEVTLVLYRQNIYDMVKRILG